MPAAVAVTSMVMADSSTLANGTPLMFAASTAIPTADSASPAAAVPMVSQRKGNGPLPIAAGVEHIENSGTPNNSIRSTKSAQRTIMPSMFTRYFTVKL
jgi:hypothetical protein